MDTPVQIKIGKNAKVYRNSGSYGSPSWTEIDIVQSVTLSLTKSEAEVTFRGGGGWEAIVPTIKRASIDIMILHQTQDSSYQVLRAAYMADTVLDYLIVDTTRTTQYAEGLRLYANIMEFTREEPIDGVLTDKLVLKPALADQNPTWYIQA